MCVCVYIYIYIYIYLFTKNYFRRENSGPNVVSPKSCKPCVKSVNLTFLEKSAWEITASLRNFEVPKFLETIVHKQRSGNLPKSSYSVSFGKCTGHSSNLSKKEVLHECFPMTLPPFF